MIPATARPNRNPGPLPEGARYDGLDLVRGLALLAMIAYHGTWDLVMVGLSQADLFNDPLWLVVRAAILSPFLAVMGAAMVVATRGGVRWARFGRRLARIAAAAAIISLATWIALPQSFVFFGVLHHVALASVIIVGLTGLPPLLLAGVAAAILAVWGGAASPLFDAAWLRWVGLGTVPPNSVDYVPLFPWMAAVFAGMAWARLGLPRRFRAFRARTEPARALVWLGRRSLWVYLAHQPILVGLIVAYVSLTGHGNLVRFGL